MSYQNKNDIFTEIMPKDTEVTERNNFPKGDYFDLDVWPTDAKSITYFRVTLHLADLTELFIYL